MYHCATCRAPVTVVREVVVRTCKHAAAPIVANIAARMEGHGGLR